MRNFCGDCDKDIKGKLNEDCSFEYGTCYQCWIGTVWAKMAASLV